MTCRIVRIRGTPPVKLQFQNGGSLDAKRQSLVADYHEVILVYCSTAECATGGLDQLGHCSSTIYTLMAWAKPSCTRSEINNSIVI